MGRKKRQLSQLCDHPPGSALTSLAVDKCPGSAIILPRTALTWRGAPLVDGTANWGFPRVDAVYETAVPSVLWDTAPARRGGEGVVVKPGAGRGDRSGR